jgi:uncharacterized protein YndB with AHSA1/START domain
VQLRWPGGEQMTGSVLRCDPPRLLGYSWQENGEDAESRCEARLAGQAAS